MTLSVVGNYVDAGFPAGATVTNVQTINVHASGPTVPIIDAVTGEIRPASIFVAVLGASSYTFACATTGLPRPFNATTATGA